MLEEIALKYSELSEEQIETLNYVLVIVGGIVGGLTNRSLNEIRRAPYFALSGLIFFGVAAVSFAGIEFLVQALVSGFFWVIVGLEMLAVFAGGFFLARIAAARSRDAYGHGRMAVLAFIPIANFWLLLTPSKNEASANRAPTIPLLTGVFGVVLGFTLLGFGVALSAYSQVEGLKRVERAAEAGVFNTVMLDRTLAAMAADVETPAKVDNITTLLRVDTDNETLRYIYRVETDDQSLKASASRRTIKQNCSHGEIAQIFKDGATIEHIYRRIDGSEFGTVVVNRAVCEAVELEASAKVDEAKITELIEASPASEMYRALKGYFPEEANYFRESMMTLLENGADEDEAFSKMLTVGSEIRRRHAPNLRAAPDQSLLAILQSQTQMIAAFDNDPVLCNRIVMFGAGAIPENQRHRVLALMDSARLLYQAMYEGERFPVQRGQATDDDWGKLIADFYAAGGTDDELNLVVQPDIQNPHLCSTMLRFLRVLSNADFPGSDRIRAEMVTAMNEG